MMPVGTALLERNPSPTEEEIRLGQGESEDGLPNRLRGVYG